MTEPLPLDSFAPIKLTGESSNLRPMPAEMQPCSLPTSFLGRHPVAVPGCGGSTDLSQASAECMHSDQRTSTTPSVSYVASSLSLLESACLDPTPYYRLSAAGRVECGTLEGLISRLFTERIDHNYRNAFFITYRIFTSNEAFLEVLIRHFTEAGMDVCQEVLGYSILDLLMDWLQKGYVEKDIGLLQRTRQFCNAVRGAPALTELAVRISAITDQRIQLLRSSQFPMSPHAHERTVPSSPYELAIALTVLEGARFAAILPSECVAYLCERSETGRVPTSPNALNLALETNKRISNWVKKSILCCNDPEERIARTKFMCNTAAECRTLRNYSSMWAIRSALESPVLTRLPLTRKGLSASEEQSLKDIDQIMSQTEGRKAYQSLLELNLPCVPYLGGHLLDIRDIFGKLPATVVSEDRVCINFTRCAELAKAVTSVIGRYKPPELSDICIPGAFAYLNSQLKRVGEHTAAEFEARSMELSAEELAARTSHRRELAFLGFTFRRTRASRSRRNSDDEGVPISEGRPSVLLASGQGSSVRNARPLRPR